MALIDGSGRLFGRVNIIDAIVALFLLGLVPLGYGAFVLFRTPVPTVTAVEPRQIAEGQGKVSLRISGRDLRPFLRARLGVVETQGLLALSPTVGEIHLPEHMPLGTYDLTLSDEGRELVRVPDALTVVPAAPRTAIADLRVGFVVRPEVLDVIKPGDVDVGGPLAATDDDRAVLTAIDADRQTLTGLDYIQASPLWTFQIERTLVAFRGTVRVPLVLRRAGWEYKERAVKVGVPFVFETTEGFMGGTILDMELQAPAEAVSR